MRRSLAFAIPLLVVLCLGLWLGGHPTLLPSALRSVFVRDDLRLYAEAAQVVGDDYYRKVPQGELADQAIKGMVSGLDDRFSAYFPPKEYRRFQATQRSEFTGIGVVVQAHPLGLRIVHVYKGSPAAKAGIRDGDVIVQAGPTVLKGLTQRESTSHVQGPAGSTVRLRVRRGGRVRALDVGRAVVRVPTVSSRIIRHDGQRIGYLSLSQFGPGDHAKVYSALDKLKSAGATRYVFDLRRNGGGRVDEAQLIASAFLKGGTIVTTRGRSVPTTTLHATGDPIVPTAPLVVLVDRDTASASEIVAGALQDRGRAKLVGDRTFGKGVFQQVLELSNGGALDLTAGQYFTPKGRNLGGRGVTPGTGLEPDVRAKDDPATPRDEALDAAIATVQRQR